MGCRLDRWGRLAPVDRRAPHHLGTPSAEGEGVMARTIELRFQVRDHGEKRIKITPAWAGKGIAIHKPIRFDLDDGQFYLQEAQGVWRLSHINSGMSLGSCMGNLDRAKSFARAWDGEFAALQSGADMAPDRMKAWKAVVQEMHVEPPRKPRQPAIRRGREVA